MNDNTLRKVQLLQLDMAYFVKKICEENNIEYFLIAGTLLGSVRHKGFIPWDDDLDIGMLRKDYEKFIKIFNGFSGDKYHLQTWNTEKNYALPTAKIRLNNTKYIEQNSYNVNIHHGVYIDILPFDNVPDSSIHRKIHNIKTYILKRLLLSKFNYELWENNDNLKKFFYSIIKLITKFISSKTLKKSLYKEMTKYNNLITSKVVTFGGSYGYKKESILKSFFEESRNFIFEEKNFKSFYNYEKYLLHLYGDFNVLPPEDKRYNRHKIIKIELD